MSNKDLKLFSNDAYDKENIKTTKNTHTAKENTHTAKENTFELKTAPVKNQVVVCKVSKFEDDSEDTQLFARKQTMPLRSI